MKKTILIELLLLFGFSVALACSIKLFVYANGCIETIEIFREYADVVESYRGAMHTAISYAIPSLIAALGTLAAGIIIAVKDFPCFKPLIDKFKAKREAKAVAKTEKAEADKKARIEQLQAELDELKKDE